MAAKDGDVVLVPKGHHPCAAPYGYEMYYLNVMAGPLENGVSKMTLTTTGLPNEMHKVPDFETIFYL